MLLKAISAPKPKEKLAMKIKVLLTSTLCLLVGVLSCFAQGKIGFGNDSVHLAYYSDLEGDYGGAIYDGDGYLGRNMVADLYMGTSSTLLYLYATATFTSTPGEWNPVNVKADGTTLYGAPTTGPAIASGSVFIMAQVRDTGGPAETTINSSQLAAGQWSMAAAQGLTYCLWSQEFAFTLGTLVVYPVMWNTPDWTPGTQNMSEYGAGEKGAVPYVVPEPASFALAGLGGAAMLIFRRRK
jgi:hypothetical protein